MKIFNRILMVTFVIIMSLSLMGCGEPKNAKQVANLASSDANRIIRTLNNFDYASDSQLEIKDISPINTDSKQSAYSINNQSASKSSVIKNKIYNSQNASKHYSTNNIVNKNTNVNNKFSTQKLKNFKYAPKYVNSASENFSTDNLQNYFDKIEDLYTSSCDSICANQECANSKERLKISCDNLKVCCDKINKGEKTLTDSQVQSCNQNLVILEKHLNTLNLQKGKLSSLIKTLKPLLNNYSTNFEKICSCYQLINECLDSRINTINDCTTCVDNICDIIECKNQNQTLATNSSIKSKTTSTNSTNNKVKTKDTFFKQHKKQS